MERWKSKLKFFKQIPILMILLLFLTGCWDEVEIEERAFVSGVAVDLAEEQSSSTTKIELTSQLIVPANLSSSKWWRWERTCLSKFIAHWGNHL